MAKENFNYQFPKEILDKKIDKSFFEHRLERVDLFSSEEYRKRYDEIFKDAKNLYFDSTIAKKYIEFNKEVYEEIQKTALSFVSITKKEKTPKSDVEKCLCEMIDNFADSLYINRKICFDLIQTILRKLKINLDKEYENKLDNLPTLRTNEMSFCISMGSQPALVESQITESPVALVQKRGNKIDLIRIANAIYELGLVEHKNGGKLTKQEFFTTFGKAFNLDLSDYDKDLSNSMASSVAYERQTQIFEEMKQKHLDIYNSM